MVRYRLSERTVEGNMFESEAGEIVISIIPVSYMEHDVATDVNREVRGFKVLSLKVVPP